MCIRCYADDFAHSAGIFDHIRKMESPENAKSDVGIPCYTIYCIQAQHIL